MVPRSRARYGKFSLPKQARDRVWRTDPEWARIVHLRLCFSRLNGQAPACRRGKITRTSRTRALHDFSYGLCIECDQNLVSHADYPHEYVKQVGDDLINGPKRHQLRLAVL